MLRRMLICSLLLFACLLPAGAQSLLTPGEINGYSRYTQHDEVVRFLSALSAHSRTLQVREVGRTRPVEGFSAKSLLLCILTAEGVSRPEQLDRSKPTLFITAAKHGSEQSAKEAALLILRDFAVGELKSLLEKVNLLIMPMVNPWGNYFDRRVNEIGLDMNRDHIKMESEGVQAIHRVFRAWMPEVTLDVHEQGDKYYRISMGCVSNLNVDPAIEAYSRRVILNSVGEALARDKITFHEYIVTSENMPSDASGADFSDEELARWPQITRHSTTDINDGRNILGLYQTFSFIQEAASRHDLATLAARTRWQERGIRAFIQAVAEHGPEMTAQVNDLRRQLLEQAAIFYPEHRVHIRMEYRRDPARPDLRLKEFQRREPAAAGRMKVEKRAGEVLLHSEIEPLPELDGQKVVERVEKEWYPLVAPTLSVVRPLGYVIPAQHAEVIATLQLHGIMINVFTEEVPVKVEGSFITAVKPSKYDYVAPERIEVEARRLVLPCKKGDFYISCRQPAANLLPCLLEPASDFGLVRYWKYGLVPEATTFYPFYRVIEEQAPPLVPYAAWPD